MPNCKPAEVDGRQKCEVCGIVFPAGLKLPIRAQCGAVKDDATALTVRVQIRRDDTPQGPPPKFVDLPCVRRRETVATVPAGLCGAKTKMVSVALCVLHKCCTAFQVARTEAQRVDGKFPKACDRCPDQKPPDGAPI